MKRKKLTTESGFRLIRVFSIDHNARRFRKHVERLQRDSGHMRWHKRLKTKLDRVRRREAQA